ncbi:MAG: UDP-N-acetylmuramoyl-L-alanyl-D-glutamate--2,6-diaminopimelate ligase [Crocinitomicaceae bacterium]|nr:UDP-N-acetylmuramoyl-L-alanyl-D-glutamate--2,6-diaminopimelate ligase [Crocinitomicaceae bacterium]MBK8926968.1 UDP-N-acetylmuramoyl-L-alanyl-D-glutamate--2,6-diaminopimelate ligase [Crocinitomicaceae bacterium]
MKNLQDILYKVNIVSVHGTTDRMIEAVVFDSRKVVENSAFVAVRGVQADGHAFIEKAILQGATAIICETLPEKRIEQITYVQVKDSSVALAYMATNYFDNPSQKITLVGITGTNGKTTTTTLLHDLFTGFGHACGLISTVVNKIGNREIPSTHTTPDPVELNRLLNEMVNVGCKYCFMEVSSHAIHQHRITGLEYKVAAFTNITHDHLDYHKTFKEYILAKKAFFDQLPSSAISVINIDDANGDIMVQNTKAKVRKLALLTLADYKAKIIENSFSGLVLSINGHEVYTHLIGGFNAYNLLTVYAVAVELGYQPLDVLVGISSLKSVEGRFQYFNSDKKITAIVDYAHTPDALKNVLGTIQSVRTRNEQVITIVGCGGDRDRTKRPVMATIAADMSDRVILTSDNPRSENPDEIIREMQTGVPAERYQRVLSITNRAEAIKVACTLAQPGDILLIAGKGHEKYQEINGVKHPFDDFETVKQTLKSLQK